MKKGIICAMLLFCGAITAAYLLFITISGGTASEKYYKADLGGQIVTLNEVVNISDELKKNPTDTQLTSQLKASIGRLDLSKVSQALNANSRLNGARSFMLNMLAINIVFMLLLFVYIYIQFLRPFKRLDKFAARVAAGNLDMPLDMPRHNYFGAFTWSFDLLRTELKKSRQSEYTAQQEKKALIAAISHDIKTPVASIRAYAEAITEGMAKTPERMERYLNIIIKKADEVSNLTNDLFLHAVSDMDKLTITVESCEAEKTFNEILDPFVAEYGNRLNVKTEIPKVTLLTDPRRLAQALENLITNAAKYAPDSPMEISYKTSGGFMECTVRDWGGGISPEDIPFIFDRFYRGKNAGDVRGSGLGLFIVKYIMEKTEGKVRLENMNPGLAVTLGIKIEESSAIG